MNGPSTSFLSYLDLISCTFGAAVLLFLIVSAADTPAPGDEAPPMVLVRCSHLQGPKAEVGIEFRRAGEARWRRAGSDLKQVEAFAASSEADSGAEAFLLLPAPASGEWEFRPYLIDFPKGVAAPGPLRVKIEAHGENVRSEDKPEEPRDMKYPGDFGQAIKVSIGGR